MNPLPYCTTPTARLRSAHAGFTLVEVMVATMMTLILIAAVATLFPFFTDTVSDARAVTAMQDNLRQMKNMLQNDLSGATASTSPPSLRRADNSGYVEIIEGPIGPVFFPFVDINNPDQASLNFPWKINDVKAILSGQYPATANPVAIDSTIGDGDDILMFTTHSATPYRSMVNSGYSSNYAEVVWFLRGKTLYREVFPIIGGAIGAQPSPANTNTGNFYPQKGNGQSNAISYGNAGVPSNTPGYRQSAAPYQIIYGTTSMGTPSAAPNTTHQPNFPSVATTLKEMSRRENRFAHQPLDFPHESRWLMRTLLHGSGNQQIAGRPGLMMPTLAEMTQSEGFGVGVGGYSPNRSSSGSASIVRDPNKLGRYGDSRPLKNDGYGPAREVVLGTFFDARVPFDPTYRWVTPHPTDPSNNVLAFDMWSATPLNLMWKPPGSNYAISHAPASIADPNHRGTLAGQLPIESLVLVPPQHLRSGGFRMAVRSEDIMMTNVLSFDIKLWDPGAPSLMVTSSPPQMLQPGDVDYGQRLADFIVNGGPGAVTIAGFGAYVDMNYMWQASMNSSVNTNDPYGFNPLSLMGVQPNSTLLANTYELALRKYETSIKVPVGSLPRPRFGGPGNEASKLSGLPFGVPPHLSSTGGMAHHLACIYDSWTNYYERDGIDQNGDGVPDSLFNGIDDFPMHADGTPGAPFVGGIDDPSEVETVPPYNAPLRGIQIKIRVYEPDSRQIREVTVTHDFLQE